MCVRWAWVAVLPLLASGCSTMGLSQRPLVPDGEKCLELYAKVDERIDKAGARDAGYYRIPGFPYLRSDRYSASFAKEIPDIDAFWEWVGYLRANEDEAREVELLNMGLSVPDASSLLLDLRGCGGWLRSWELDDAEFRERLIAAVQPPDEYSSLRRALGLYPLAAPFLHREQAALRRDVAESFKTPLAQLPTPGEPILWRVKTNPRLEYPEGTIDLQNKPRDLLGRVGLLWSEVVHLAHTYAPALWIPTAGDYDRPGLPVHTEAGPDVDVRQPVVYFLPGLTRFGGRSLLQINYFVWFSEHLSSAADEGAGGPMDGLIWRVTLDEHGMPLFYDSIHASGGPHLGFAPQALQARDTADEDTRMLLPQAEVPTDAAIALRLASGTHAVQRVLPMKAVDTPRHEGYELRSYDELLLLPRPGGGTQSLFDAQGTIAGTERGERFWLWPSGIRNVGALRQWGRHPISLVGRAHFDDPFLLERQFVAPSPAPSPATKVSDGGGRDAAGATP